MPKNPNLHTKTELVTAGAEAKVYFMSVRVFVDIYLVLKPDTVQTVASAQTMTSLVFMRRFRFVLGQWTLSLIV